MNLLSSESTMKKSYKVKVIPGAGEPQTLDITSSTGVGSTTVKALPGSRYQLIDAATGFAPDNIRATRKGKDLRVNFDGRDQADLVIADFYAFSAADANTLLGESQTGVYHAYIPESGDWARSISQLTDGVAPTGMALASESIALADFTPASLGVVAVAAGINPLWAAPLLLLGAAGGGGSGGSSAPPDTTPPVIKSAVLYGLDDTGVSATDGITNNSKPRIEGMTEANAKVKITINGRDYTGQADALGYFLIPVTDALSDSLPNSPQTYTVKATDAAGNESAAFPGTPFTVDTNAPAAPTGMLYGLDDLGLSATDNITSDNTPRITGNAEPNATVKITINGRDYVGQADAQGRYVIQVTDALPDSLPLPISGQTYKVQATDAAGNSTTAEGTPFRVDASSISTTQGVSLSIDAITRDTGVSQTDFVTADNTLAWSGKLIESNTAKFNTDDWVQLQMVDAQSQVRATQYIKPTLTAGIWNWNWPLDALPLQDGVYTLKAQLVDTAGNALSAPWAWSQNATVDTQPQKLNDLPDPNANFNVNIIRLVQDRGLSTSDFVTNTTQVSFAGNVTSTPGQSAFNPSTGRVLAEVIDNSGKVVVFQYLTPSATGDWTFDNTPYSLGVANAVTTYTLKTSTVDLAGHFMNATSHAFTVDLQTPVVSNPGVVTAAGTHDYSQMSFSADEKGIFIFNSRLQTGPTLDLGGLTHFEPKEFNMVFRDTAGNERAITNTQAWDFHLTQPITLAMGSSGPGGFDNGQLVGSVGPVGGKYVMASGQNLDLSSLYTLTPAAQANGGLNHIVMGTGAQTLTISIGDVLELGISNSFSNAIAHKDHLQMRVDSDSADNLNLTKQWGHSTDQGWILKPVPVTLDVFTYNVYYNETLKIDLFVQSAIHVTVI